MSQPKRGRGRPRKGPKKLALNWRRFMCEYANPVAQVFVCRDVEIKKKMAASDPTSDFTPGDRLVVYMKATERGPEECVWPGPKAKALSREEAQQMAEVLFLGTDEEDRFGSLDGPHPHILYRNRYYEVQFSQAMSFERPFVIVDTRFHKVLVDKAGKPRRFYTFGGALKLADEEEGKLIR